MPSKICARCGKSFQGSLSDVYCNSCRNASSYSPPALLNNNDLKKREAIRNYVRDHQGVSDREVAGSMGVSKKFIKSMMQDGVFENKGQNYQRRYTCAKCGTTITSGVYCRECLVKLRDVTKAIGVRRENLKRIMFEEKATVQRENVVLVIDIDEMNSTMVKFILEKEMPECKIRVADNLMKAIQFLHGMNVKLIIIDDASKDDFDGFRILDSIRGDSVAQSIPAVVMSGSPSKDNLAKALSMGALDYITKPFTPKDFVARINKALNTKFVGVAKRTISKILIIDDQPSDVQREKNILETKLPCEVTTANSGVEGLYVLNDKEIHLLLVSMNMSFMSGTEVLSFIRRDEKLRKIPVIMMVDDADNLNTPPGASIKGYIRKPDFTIEGLLQIEKVLKGRVK